MAKVSANYEVVYIIDPAQGEENTAALVAKFKTLAEQNGSAVEVEEWGSRKLAYPINYKTEGYYVLMTFTSEPSFPKELDRVLRITDGIMRSLIVCKGEYGGIAMLNKIIIMGRLTRDPELRRTGSGTAVTSFSLAVDRDFKSQTGEKETDFIDIVAWRGTAEFVSKYFTKGRMAVVEGRLQIRDWTDKDGGKRRSAEVVADNVYFGDSKRDSAGDFGGAPASYSAPMGGRSAAPMGGQSDFAEIGEEDGELPF